MFPAGKLKILQLMFTIQDAEKSWQRTSNKKECAREPDKGRNKVCNIMKKLEADGKVVIEQKAVKETGARKQYVYKLKES